MQSPIIKIDILKPIGTLVDLTGQFNARVGDAYTPITIQWTEGGNAKNLDGLHPVFEAVVGQGHVENNEILMNDDAVPVRWVGDQSSIRGYGQTILKLPPQVFSKSGLCYGYLALENDQGVRETSVDIWFKVLGGVYNMGLACNYFITDFQKALAKAKGDVFQALDEIKKNYELKIQSAENAIATAEEDLRNSKKSMQTAVDEFTSKTNDLTNRLETQATTGQATLNALEAKINQDLFTQAEADAYKQAIVDQMAKLFEQAKAAVSDKHVATNMANFALAQGDNYTLSLPPYDQDSFTHATTVPHGESVVNVAFITDNHWQEDGNDIFDNSDGYAYHSLQHYQWFAEGTLLSKPDIVIADGDNVNGDDNRTSNIYTTCHVKAMLDASYIKSSVFMIPGNHDLGIGQFDGSKKPGTVMSNDDLKSIYNTKPCRFGEVRNGDSLYFYKDLPDKKVRIIGLNSSDGPMTTGADGNYIWDAINVHVFSAEQLSWLVNKALVLPDNSWQVAIFFHAPIGKAFGGWDKESAITINSDCLLDILNAFKNGATTSCNSSNALAPISGLTANFTSQGKGTIIGIFNGHFHKDMQDLSTLNGTPMVETDASLASQHNKDRYNTVNEDCWETISIDTAKRTIHCYRFGRGQDREFNY